MFSSWSKHLNKISIAALVCACCFQGAASAWQFRDLEDAPPQSLDESSSHLIDLIPTDQEFSAPIVNAAGRTVEPALSKTKAKPLEVKSAPSKTTAKSLEVKSAPKAKPKVKPKADIKPKAEPKPVPVPMPELGTKKADGKPSVDATTKAALLDPLDVFKKSLGSPKSASDIYSAIFNGVQAGSTTKTEVLDIWGKPARIIPQDDDSTTLIYKVPSFRQVDVAIANDTVTGVLVHLTKPIDANKAAKELAINEFVAVPVPDAHGEVLGQAYPERGILFSFVEGTAVARISAIILEPISSEMFRMRAQYDFGHNFKRSLADLADAIRIDPIDAESYWLQSEYLDAVGQTREGLKSAQKAIRLKPTNPSYRITRSRLFAKTNRLQHAIEELEAVIDEIEMPTEIAGYAHNLLADFLAIGPNANHQEALRHHLKAVEYASKSVEDRRFAVRRMAKRVLVTAHLSISRDIALGNFQRQAEVVPKWLLRATELADEFISDDQGDELLQMQIFRDTLASYSELQQGTFDAAIATEEALKTGRDLIADADDEYYQVAIQRMLAETLLHASKIHRSRGKHDSALQFATNALALLDASSENWENTAHDNYLEAELHFMVGSIHAIRDQNHQEAVDWYGKARSGFVGSNFVTSLYSNRRHGEMYVSMGLSFWETGDRDKAVKITQTGAELMKKAIESGSMEIEAMAIPYGNLATMHVELGHGDKSQEYAKLVAQVDEVSKTKR